MNIDSSELDSCINAFRKKLMEKDSLEVTLTMTFTRQKDGALKICVKENVSGRLKLGLTPEAEVPAKIVGMQIHYTGAEKPTG